jgi:hypothetical protein
MTPDEFESMAADVLADQFARLRADLESRVDRAVAGRALPPFVPPSPWLAGTHGAGAVVRHRNGLFMARRDTASEPPGESWLPLVVGFAGLDVTFDDDRTLRVRAELSDGTVAEATQTFAVPITRGAWDAAAVYYAGDRVLRGAEYQAIANSCGVDPSLPNQAWLKVAGRRDHGRLLKLSLTDDGDFVESGHVIGSIKPLMTKLLTELVDRHTPAPA